MQVGLRCDVRVSVITWNGDSSKPSQKTRKSSHRPSLILDLPDKKTKDGGKKTGLLFRHH